MSDRLQQEIEEILGKYKRFPLREPLWRRIRRRLSRWLSSLGRWPASHLPRITVGRVMLLGIAMVIAAYFFGFGSDSIARSVIVAGLILFVAAFIFSLRRRTPYVEKRWRGQPLEIHQPGVGDRLRSWWDRWRSRGRTNR
jgi:VIT1/CCC1 family predicted Fe2+/Mn2+ transporter